LYDFKKKKENFKLRLKLK